MSMTVTGKDVEIRTPDGVCDAALFHPAEGAYPGVVVWTDAFGLRLSMRGIGQRLAGEGYTVLVPNPFYRVGTAESLGLDTGTLSFQNPDHRARLQEVRSGVMAPGAAERDSEAYAGFLDTHPSVDRGRGMGVHGYCMGGALAFRTAAAQPGRVAALASFHGGGLVTDAPDSPHRLVPLMKARAYIGIASNDDERQPDAKDILREAFESANLPAEVEVYPALHGWCVPDMPAREGEPIYNEAEAERAWGRLVALYRAALG